VPFWNTIYRPT